MCWEDYNCELKESRTAVQHGTQGGMTGWTTCRTGGLGAQRKCMKPKEGPGWLNSVGARAVPREKKRKGLAREWSLSKKPADVAEAAVSQQ